MALVGIAVLALAGAFLAISLSSSNTQTNQNEPQTKQIKIRLTETENEAKVWVPSTVYLKKGEMYELVVVNGDDDDEHRLSIPSLGVETEDIAPANGQETVLFTANNEGSHAFIDPTVPEWGSAVCSQDVDDPPCVPPGQVIVEP